MNSLADFKTSVAHRARCERFYNVFNNPVNSDVGKWGKYQFTCARFPSRTSEVRKVFQTNNPVVYDFNGLPGGSGIVLTDM